MIQVEGEGLLHDFLRCIVCLESGGTSRKQQQQNLFSSGLTWTRSVGAVQYSTVQYSTVQYSTNKLRLS